MKALWVRSSAAAMRTRCKYWSGVSPTLTTMSWLVAMSYLPWNKKARAEAPAKTTDPKGGRIRRGDTGKARISSCLLGWGVAQVGPIDIGAQVFAAHGAIGGAFDGWAALGWDRPESGFPLRDQRRSDLYGTRQLDC